MLGRIGFAERLVKSLSPKASPSLLETKSLAAPSATLLELFNSAPSVSGLTITPAKAMTCPPVRAAVQVISETIGQLPVDAKTNRVIPVSERLNTCLLYVSSNLSNLSRPFRFTASGTDKKSLRLAALSASFDASEVGRLLRMLVEMRYLDGRGALDGSGEYSITAAGWHRVEELRARAGNAAQVFVAMWFDEQLNEPYENGLAIAIRDSGYQPIRIDKKHHNNKIDDEIIAEIRRSRFLVADFTCAPKQVRGGVYFEAGFAMGLGLPVIWTCRDTSLEDLHFDTRQYAHIVWKDSADLHTQLKARIGATIGDGPLIKTTAP